MIPPPLRYLCGSAFPASWGDAWAGLCYSFVSLYSVTYCLIFRAGLLEVRASFSIWCSFRLCSLVAQRIKHRPAMWETRVWSRGLIPGLGKSPGEGNGNPRQYSCLENPMDRGAWRAIQSTGPQRVGHDWAGSLFLFPQGLAQSRRQIISKGWVEHVLETRSSDYVESESESCSVWLFATPWTIQSIEFSRPEYWSG